jgi:transcriptional regulator with XRE-family HTH domain
MTSEVEATVDLSGIGDRLRRARERVGLSQEAAAQAVGLSRVILAYYETGARQPSLTALTALAGLYQVRLSYLVGEGEEDAPTEAELSSLLFRASPEALRDEPKAGMRSLPASSISHCRVGSRAGSRPRSRGPVVGRPRALRAR